MSMKWFGSGLLLAVLAGCSNGQVGQTAETGQTADAGRSEQAGDGGQPAQTAGSAHAAETAQSAQTPQSLDTDEAKTLYALGLVLGRNVAIFNLTPAEVALVQRGLSDAVTGAKPEVDLETYGPKIDALAKSRAQAKAAGEKEKSTAYLEQAAKQPGAVKTDSGMIFIPITPGKGASPSATDKVKVNYRGTLTDGTEFDSSYKRGEPAEFVLNQVIPCWTEGVQKLKVGGKARLICPSSIAYGDMGHPPVIPGGATLVFEVELLDIEK